MYIYIYIYIYMYIYLYLYIHTNRWDARADSRKMRNPIPSQHRRPPHPPLFLMPTVGLGEALHPLQQRLLPKLLPPRLVARGLLPRKAKRVEMKARARARETVIICTRQHFRADTKRHAWRTEDNLYIYVCIYICCMNVCICISVRMYMYAIERGCGYDEAAREGTHES